MRYVFNVIASVGRQTDVYRPIKIKKSYRPTEFFNVIAALIARNKTDQNSHDCRETLARMSHDCRETLA